MQSAFIVRNIIGDAVNGIVRVTIASELFNQVVGKTPVITPTYGVDKQGNKVSVFVIEGVKLYSKNVKVIDEKTGLASWKTQFYMDAAEAAKRHVPYVSNLEVFDVELPA